jgi:hypothetical protein
MPSVDRLAACTAGEVDVQVRRSAADHIGSLRGQREANGTVARVPQQDGGAIPDQSQRRSATLVAEFRVAWQERAAAPIETPQLEPRLLGTGCHLTQSNRTASLTGPEGDPT